MSDIDHILRTLPFEARRKALAELPQDALVTYILNDHLNRYLRDLEGVDELIEDAENEKPVPYMGWGWRNVDFAAGRVPIGGDGDYVGVMRKNKWSYPERDMTPAEFETFMGYLDRLILAPFAMADETDARIPILRELRAWMATLEVF